MKKITIMAVLVLGFVLVHGHPVVSSTSKATSVAFTLVHGHPVSSPIKNV